MNQVNYQLELDKILQGLEESSNRAANSTTNSSAGEVPTLLLHSCCAPCSSYCLTYLAEYFRITVFYYNPNISPAEEYQKRVEEQKRLLRELPLKYPVSFQEGKYDPERFFSMAEGMEELPEGGERCFRCYELRQREAAVIAKEGGFDYFTTTLSLSPHKNAQKLNTIGLRLQEEYGVSYLVSDFKKRGGYLKSIELSKQYDLYRQDYCGCVYSKMEAINAGRIHEAGDRAGEKRDG